VITVTLNQIRRHSPCEDGWRKLLVSKGKTQADDEPFPLEDVLDSNGLYDCMWCLRALGPEHHGWMRHFAVDCAEDVRHLLIDERSLEALAVARRFADGKATDDELAAAWAAARAASSAAAWAAESAAAWAAVRAAARAASNAAAWAASNAAARAAQSPRLREYLRNDGRRAKK